MFAASGRRVARDMRSWLEEGLTSTPLCSATRFAQFGSVCTVRDAVPTTRFERDTVGRVSGPALIGIQVVHFAPRLQQQS
eukprot:170418-Rhodomonas_salina.3